MTTKHGLWRSAAAYDYLADLDPAELAWEFLRRNPLFQREYRESLKKGPEGEEALAERWGLRFRDPSKPARRSRRNLLDSES